MDTAIDPVCGMEVSKKDAVKKTVNGETFYFCCGGCAKKFAG
jgi:Cu+-exporting ATPase